MLTLLRFLAGNRNAILRLAGDRSTLWAGLLFVISAGLARDYDGADLTRQPWWLLVPVGASLLVSFLLFVGVYVSIRFSMGKVDEPGPRLWQSYRVFLGLFWMTGPLALLYAIPYERLLSPASATEANLWTLGLVATWRVLLITRVLSVLTGRTFFAMLFQVMLVADGAMLVGLYAMPAPILGVMGGIRLTEREQTLLSTTMLAMMAGLVTMPIWLVGGGCTLHDGKTRWKVESAPQPSPPSTARRGLLWLSAASVLAWAPVLPFTQREQRLRSEVEQDLKAGHIAEALATLSAHAPGDFPPQWDPPPRPGYGDRDPELLDVVETIADRGAADWVRAIYIAKLEQAYLSGYRPYVRDAAELARIERLLDRLPEGPSLRQKYAEAIEFLRRVAADTDRTSSTQPTTLPPSRSVEPAQSKTQ